MDELKLVFTAPNALIVNNLCNLLHTQGVACMVRNEYLAGGAGELPLNEIWPEIWVAARDLSRAEAIIRDATSDSGEADWRCAECGEENGAGFEFCWHCGAGRPY